MQEERDGDRRIARVAGGELATRAAPPRCRRAHRRPASTTDRAHRGTARRRSAGSPSLAEAPRQVTGTEPVEQRERLVDRTEPAQRVERRQGADQLRLGMRVAVDPIRRERRRCPAASSRAKPATACSALGWVCSESGSPAASTFSRYGQLAGDVGEMRASRHERRRAGVGAEPQLRPRPSVGLDARAGRGSLGGRPTRSAGRRRQPRARPSSSASRSTVPGGSPRHARPDATEAASSRTPPPDRRSAMPTRTGP